MRVIKWIIRGVLGLIGLAALCVLVLLIWPQLVVPEFNPKIGTGVSRGTARVTRGRAVVWIPPISRWSPRWPDRPSVA